MPITTGSGQIRPNFLLEQLPSTTGQYIGATVEDTWKRSPMSSINYMLKESEAGGGNPAFKDLDWTWQSPFFDYDEPEVIPRMSQEDGEAQVKQLPYEIKIPKNGITQPHLDLLKKTRKEEMIRNNLIEMSPDGFAIGAMGFTAALMTSFGDPLNIASAFIPVIGPSRYSSMLAKAGTSSLRRAGIRMKVGALEGAAGATLVEPIIYESAQRQQAEYGAVDSVMAIGFGAIFGGGLHMGAGAISDGWNGIKGLDPDAPPGTNLVVNKDGSSNVDWEDPTVRKQSQLALRSSRPMGRIGKPSLVNDQGFVASTGSLPHRLDGMSDNQRKQLARIALGQMLNDEEISVDGMMRVLEMESASIRLKPIDELDIQVAKAEVETLEVETSRLKGEVSKLRFNKFRNELQKKLKAEGLSNSEIHARLKPEAYAEYRKVKGAMEKRIDRNESHLRNTKLNAENKANQLNYEKTFNRSALSIEVNKAVRGMKDAAKRKKVYHEPDVETKAQESLAKVEGKADDAIMEEKLETVKEKVKQKTKERGDEYVDLDPETAALHKAMDDEGLVYETFMSCLGRGA